MALVEKRTPYEFLVRWNIDGIINGAHIVWVDSILKDNELISQNVTSAESVAIGEQTGFPLLTVLKQINIDNLIKLGLLDKENLDLKNELSLLQNKESETSEYINILLTEIERLKTDK